ncbi:MAG: hypothetical protein VB029_09735 [Anaerolineaceae bacterium]|nr:hypothetical protein [Anaerolineaceae bacterium]
MTTQRFRHKAPGGKNPTGVTSPLERAILAMVFLFLVASCGGSASSPNPSTPSPTLLLVLPDTPTATQWEPTFQVVANVETPLPIEIDPTHEQIQYMATVWSIDPLIPILNYHRFTPNRYDPTSGMVKYLGEFMDEVNRLYIAGFTLISIDDYLAGRVIVPPGRRPLILTFDDAIFANQIALEGEGQPSPLTAVGSLYKFSQEHPDFGFQAALFANLGDKYYGNVLRNGRWYLGEGWEEALAQTIAWSIDHNVRVYNHLYTHINLSTARDKDIQPEMLRNDLALRGYLEQVGCPELIHFIRNYIALPYGVWPKSQKGIELLLGYVNPEGEPVEAVFEAGYEHTPTLAPSPYSENFSPFHLPRMAGLSRIIDWLEATAPSLPTAQQCQMLLPPDIWTQPASVLEGEILSLVQDGQCSQGIYILENRVFRVTMEDVIQLKTID